ncbi:MAG: M20/M25/M40 family metallo-hydrolase [Chloroflexi bacterium]|nr:M20/M25/M40 family metallo-hydrolase [Chloroflexota bacterium]
MTDVRDALVPMTMDLVRIPSTLDRPDQLVAAIDYVRNALKDVPRGEFYQYNSGDKPALVYSLRGQKHAKLVLNAHLDVVPARPDQFDPFIKGDRMYGRGTQDMKGAAAVLIRLAQDLAKMSEPPDVNFQFVTDEEIGGYHGTRYLLEEQGFTCDFFITAEPTDLNICHMHKGGAPVTVTIHGVPAHGSRPWEGRNPIHILRDGLMRLEEQFPTPSEPTFVTTCVPTIIKGGNAGNRIMEDLVLHCDIRCTPNETPESIVSRMTKCFPEHATIELRGFGIGLNTSTDHHAVTQLQQVILEAAEYEAEFYKEHFGTDARFYSAKGIAAVCCGPIGAGLHSDEEWVDIEGLVKNYYVFAKLATLYQ